MKISIVVPVYNAEKTLKECLDSLINQTYKNLEIILINDGSKDHSLKICKKYQEKDKRIILIDNKNHGVSYTRNVGIEKSTGDFIMFVDSDDYIDINMIKEMLNYQKTNNADLVQCNLLYFDSTRKYIPYSNMNTVEINNLTDITNSLISINYLNCVNKGIFGPVRCIGGKIYRTSIIKNNNIKFDNKIYIFEDGIFNLKYYKYANKINLINKPYYKYRQSETSTSYRYNKDQLKQYDLIFDNLKEYKELKEYQYSYYLNAFELLSAYIKREYKFKSRNYKSFKKIVKSVINKEIYKETIKIVKYNKLSKKEKLKLYCYKNKNYLLLYVFVKLRELKDE